MRAAWPVVWPTVGDSRCVEFLVTVLGTSTRSFNRGPAKSQAALCLLYLGYDFPDDFAFCKLTPPVYPELDALLREPTQSLVASGPYTGEQLRAALAAYLASGYSVIVRGPERGRLLRLLRSQGDCQYESVTQVVVGDKRCAGHSLPATDKRPQAVADQPVPTTGHYERGLLPFLSRFLVSLGWAATAAEEAALLRPGARSGEAGRRPETHNVPPRRGLRAAQQANHT